MISFREWYSKTEYKFYDDPKINFQVYILFLIKIPYKCNDKSEMIKHFKRIRVPADSEVSKKEFIMLFNEAYSKYNECLELISTNTLKVLEMMYKPNDALSSCDDVRCSEVRYYFSALGGALKILSEEQQRIIAYRYFHKMTYKNITQYMDIGYSRIKTLELRAMEEIEMILFDIYDIHKWNI